MIKLINYIYNKIVLKVFRSSCGKSLKINGRIYRRGRGQLIIGNNVTINSSKKSNVNALDKIIKKEEKSC